MMLIQTHPQMMKEKSRLMMNLLIGHLNVAKKFIKRKFLQREENVINMNGLAKI